MPSVYAGLVHTAHRRRQMTGQAGPPSDQSCPGNQLVDASTWQCVNPCADDTRPCGGQCIGYSGAPFAVQGQPCKPCPQGQSYDQVTNVCAPLCWDGSAPRSGVCPPTTPGGNPIVPVAPQQGSMLSSMFTGKGLIVTLVVTALAVIGWLWYRHSEGAEYY